MGGLIDDKKNDRPVIVAYYYPGFHPIPKNDQLLFEGWTEWEMVKNAKPHYKNHYQPRIPIWGYENETLPFIMEKKIKTAAEYGISVFHFVWYWYQQKPFMEGALERGFLPIK